MAVTSEPTTATRVLVLDINREDGRRIAETVEGTGLSPLVVGSLDELTAALKEQRSLVAMVAFEALWQDAERTLRTLRAESPGAHLVAVYSDDTPRLRLAHRLWEAGLFDSLIARSTPPHEVRPILRQALADAHIRVMEAPAEAARVDSETLARRLQALRDLSVGFVGQRAVEGLLRELQMKLPRLVEHLVLEVLLVEGRTTRLFVCPNRPVEHQAIWGLAGDICDAVQPFLKEPLRVEDLRFIELKPPVQDPEALTPPRPEHELTSMAVPMVLGGELIGCVGLLLPGESAPAPMRRDFLHLVSCQLATALRHVQALEAAESSSLVDELTQTHNRRFLGRALEEEWRRARRYRLQLAVAMVDLDHFKRVNDLHGHLVGDEVLRAFADFLRTRLRDTDHLVRYGGEEFLIVLPETGASEAALVLERLRLTLMRTPLHATRVGDLYVTFSAGVAADPGHRLTTSTELIQAADQALLEAKQTGRDRICFAPTGESRPTPEAERSGPERRRFPRMTAALSVSYIELPNFEPRVKRLQSSDLSATGIGLVGRRDELKRNAYGLVYVEDDQRPMLTKVAWVRAMGDERLAAGLRMVRPAELAGRPESRPCALVLTKHERSRAAVARVLRAAAFDADFLDEPDEPPATSRLQDYSLLVIGDSALRGALGERIQRLRRGGESPLRIVAINESPGRKSALSTIAEQQVEHLVPADDSFEEALFATLSKLLLGDYFGINKYLLWGAETLTWTIYSTSEKEQALEGIRRLADDVHCHPRIIDLLQSAVDEMMINALYVAESAKPRPPVTVQCGTDGRLLAVSVLDEHGLFQPEHLYSAIGTALRRESEGLPPDAIRAHLGFRVMLSTLTHLAVNVDPGRSTEVIGIVDLRKSLKDYRLASPSLGLFTKND